MITYYLHKRVNMYPESGGVSTKATTIYDKKLYHQGKLVLDSLDWHGVAMVEFKKHSKNGKFYLIEVNPKYWGSLDLGLAAGIHIPYLHSTMSSRDYSKLKKKTEYKKITFFWPIEDLQRVFHSEKRLKGLIESWP